MMDGLHDVACKVLAMSLSICYVMIHNQRQKSKFLPVAKLQCVVTTVEKNQDKELPAS
jgi:dihydropteroate synthase